MYTLEYFIKKFEAIPEEKIIIGKLKDKRGYHCTAGWCGVTATNVTTRVMTDEAKALGELLSENIDYKPLDFIFGDTGTPFQAIYRINDTTGEILFPGCLTPKSRILAALYSIKGKQQKGEYKDITKELATLPQDNVEIDVPQLITH